MLRQVQDRGLGYVWDMEPDSVRYVSKPKHSESQMLFGGFILAIKFAWYRIFTKSEFIEFNTMHGIKDARGNVKHGMTAEFYLEKIIRPILYDLDKHVSLMKFKVIIINFIQSLNEPFMIL